MLDVSGLVTDTVLNLKIGEVDNKTPDISGLIKKTIFEVKISEIKKKYFTTSDYDNFISDILDANLKQEELIDKSDLNTKLATLAIKGELKAEQDKIMKLQTDD